jgi:hypothetical protein
MTSSVQHHILFDHFFTCEFGQAPSIFEATRLTVLGIAYLADAYTLYCSHTVHPADSHNIKPEKDNNNVLSSVFIHQMCLHW